MQHFSYFSEQDKANLFMKRPENIDVNSHKKLLASGLGASLYSPATRLTLAQDVLKNARRGVASAILCLEDSIPDDKVEEAQENLTKALSELYAVEDKSEFPLLFIRIRNPEHLALVAEQNAEYLGMLTGFVLPKFEDLSGAGTEYLQNLRYINNVLRAGERPLYFMPVLESPQLVYRETRTAVLNGVRDLLAENRDVTLAVRIGATDMASPFGLRRSRDLTIYDVHVVSSAIADIVNTFGRASKEGYVITGAVWEHFTDRERLFKPRLRQSPFADDADAQKLRNKLILEDLDGLIREVELDRANGLLGKTVIHPLHVALVNSMSVVTHEEYSDALDIINQSENGAGARASVYRNKMNEQKPHYAWAKKTMWRASAFGVANEGITFVELLEAAMKSYV